MSAGGLDPALWHSKSYRRPALSGWCWWAPNSRILSGATARIQNWSHKFHQSIREAKRKSAWKSLSYLQFISNWTEDSIAVALAWFIALHVNLEFKSCLLKFSTIISLLKCRPFGIKNDSVDIGYPSRCQVTFGCGFPPKTSHFNFIVSPSLYGPTTVVRSLFDSSRILIRSGGTENREK